MGMKDVIMWMRELTAMKHCKRNGKRFSGNALRCYAISTDKKWFPYSTE